MLITDLHNLVTNNETQHGTSDRITGAEVRAVDNAVIDELASRGMLQAPSTAGLATISKSESYNATVPNDGIYSIVAGTPDGINTFPSADAGFVWQRMATVKTPPYATPTVDGIVSTVAQAFGGLKTMQNGLIVTGIVPTPNGLNFAYDGAASYITSDVAGTKKDLNLQANIFRVYTPAGLTGGYPNMLIGADGNAVFANQVLVNNGVSILGNAGTNIGLTLNYDAGAELGTILPAVGSNIKDFRLICRNGHLYGGSGAGGENLALNSDGSVSCGGSPAFPSAQFQIYSTTKGFLPPKMTTAQRNAIGIPTGGLIVYDTDVNKISLYNGASWVYLGDLSAASVANGLSYDSASGKIITGKIAGSADPVCNMTGLTEIHLNQKALTYFYDGVLGGSLQINDQNSSDAMIMSVTRDGFPRIRMQNLSTGISAGIGIFIQNDASSTMQIMKGGSANATPSVGNNAAIITLSTGNLRLQCASTYSILCESAATVCVAPGAGTVTYQASAQLEIVSTTKGFLRPRMVAAQRDAIASPAEGLSVYCTDTLKGAYFYNGSQWVAENPVRYTPTSGADPTGVLGQVTVDDNYVYMKTTTGWKRINLTNVP